MKLDNLKKYAFLAQTFRNGLSLVQNVRRGGLLAQGPPVAAAVLRSGDRIRHPAHRSGLTGGLLGRWYEKPYRLG
jgi:hypothetical protein